MSVLDVKRKQVELMRIQAGIGEDEFKILERMEDIKRIEDAITSKKKREAELLAEIEKLKEGN